MPLRRFHKKSKSGCAQCKRRRVRCDEIRPTCHGCKRRRESCTYQDALPCIAVPSAAVIRQTPLYDDIDLYLVYHYSTSTSLQLYPDPSASRAWQVVLPAQAQSFHLLHHGMLSLAAFSLACATDPVLCAPRSYWRARGLEHQQAGLAMFQAMLWRNEPHERDCMFAFSVVLAVIAFAVVLSTDADPTVEDIANLFEPFRGILVLWAACQDLSSSSASFWSSLEYAKDDVGPPPTSVMADPLGDLQVSELSEPCRDAVRYLKLTWIAISHCPADIRAIGRFPASSSPAFWDLVRKGDYDALRVLGHYSLILDQYKDRWWLRGWPEKLTAAIQKIHADIANPLHATSVSSAARLQCSGAKLAEHTAER